VQDRTPRNMGGADQKSTGKYQQGDSPNLDDHQKALHGAPGAYAQAVCDRQYKKSNDADQPVWRGSSGEFTTVASKCDGERRHAACLDYEEQYPSVEKSDER